MEVARVMGTVSLVIQAHSTHVRRAMHVNVVQPSAGLELMLRPGIQYITRQVKNPKRLCSSLPLTCASLQ